VLCDFDGTLAAIVEEPGAARPLPGAVDVLRGLAGRYRVTAVVSGRPLAFLVDHLAAGGSNLVLAGLYGLERRAPDGSVAVAPEAAQWRPVIGEIADAAGRELPATVEVERKGLAVTLHVRRHPGEAAAVEAWATARAAASGLAVHPGRRSWELRPPVNCDKGTIVEELGGGLLAVCFVGDDRGDLPAFGALDRLQAGGAETVKVAVRSEESPPDLLEQADVIVDGPEGALAWLRRL
jgi:trehalose 6-phosphate phosphatase